PRERGLRAATFGFVAVLPFVLWMVRNQIVGGAGLANRQIRFHTLPAVRTRVYFFQPTTWVLPEAIVLPRSLRGALALLALAGGPALFLWQARRRGWGGATNDRGPGSALPWLLLILVPCYVAVLAMNSLFLDAGTTYDGILRYLTPLFVFLVMLELVTYAVAFPRGPARWALGLVAVAWVVGGLAINTQATLSAARQGSFAGEFPRIKAEEPELARRLAAAPIVITDNPELVYYLAGRPAYTMPIKFDLYRQAFREDFNEQLDLARRRLAAGAVLVVFGEPSDEEAEVLGLLAVHPLYTAPDAVIYGPG
ncbi:MAG TPA: hypothetical protein VK449_02355, partial [Anaerolineales bacterium]|nr:hypothetical protein [Anaerolineales bacterium]